MRGARFQFCATVLALEVLVVLFAALAASGLKVASAAQVWLVAGAIALLAVLALATLRRPAGYTAGSLLQVALIACGWWVAAMWVVGGIFAGMWIIGFRLGGRIDRERAARRAAAAASTMES